MIKAAVVKYYKELDAPVLLAKGTGEIAKKIISIANKFEIPVIQNDIADHLMYIKKMSIIDDDFFDVLAEIYAFLIKIDKLKE